MTRKSDPAAKPARKTPARRARATTKPAAAAAPAVAPSRLRRDLGQQASRFALLTAMTLAAGATLAPSDAKADCALNGVAVQCGPTTTTNTSAPTNTPNDRHYQGNSFIPMGLVVAQGATVDGAGLAITNTNGGGVTVINDGAIRVNAGVQPTEGGDAALAIRAAGGSLEYVGSGSISNAGVGDGLNAENSGPGSINMNVAGPVTSATGNGISVQDGLTGTGILLNTGAVTADNGVGVLVQGGTTTGSVNITTNGAVVAGAAGVAGSLGGLSGGDLHITTNSAVQGSIGIEAINQGAGRIFIDANGPVTGTTSDGIRANGLEAVDINISGAVTGGTRGVAIVGGQGSQGNLRVRSAAAITAQNGNGVDIYNEGAGTVVVRVNDVNATTGNGIQVRDTAVGGGIDIVADDVNATMNGVDVDSISTTGSIAVEILGDVSAGGSGIVASLASGTGDVYVASRGDITSGDTGIVAFNGGSGGVAVVANGTISSEGDGAYLTGRGGVGLVLSGAIDSDNRGVYLSGGDSGQGDLVIGGGGDITAGSTGVTVSNRGSGIVSIALGDIDARVDGLTIRDTAAGGDITVQTGSITANASALDIVTRSATADIVATINGDVEGGTGAGVSLQNTAGAGATGGIDLGVSGAVRGTTGIRAINEGVGDITVNAGGPVTGLTGDGIEVVGRAEINVRASDMVTGARHGINATTAGAAPGGLNVSGGADIVALNGNGLNLVNNGTGEVFVNVGDIEATGGDGVNFSDTAQGGDIDITVGAVTALDGFGLNIGSASDTADMTVTANGDVRGGLYGASIGIGNSNGTGDVDVTLNGAVEGARGVAVVNFGNGNAHLDVSGPVTGSQGGAIDVNSRGDTSVRFGGSVDGAASGVYASGSGDVSIIGTGAVRARDGDGVYAFNDGPGSTTINLTGDVHAYGEGVVASDAVAGTGVSITTAGVISDTDFGISVSSQALDGDVVITTNGDVRALNGYGISASLRAAALGDIEITTHGRVEGREYGINAYNIGDGSVAIASSGEVIATNGVGISAIGGRDVSVHFDGDVLSATDGILAGGGLSGSGDVSVTGSGDILADEGYGLAADTAGSGRITIDISGDVRSEQNAGIVVRDTALGGDISVTTGSVYGLLGGIDVVSDSETADIAILANGDVEADDASIAVNALLRSTTATGDIDITTRGAVEGGYGIVALNMGVGDVRVRGEGPITSHDGAAVIVGGRGAVSVDLSGDIIGANDGLLVEGGSSAGGDVVVRSTGRITADEGAGVSVYNNGSGTTTVALSGAVSATNGYGVQVGGGSLDGGDIRVTTGVIASRDSAIVVSSQSTTADIDIVANGPITTRQFAIDAQLATTAAGDIRITTRDAIDSDFGVSAYNRGLGDIAIRTDGSVTAEQAAAIAATGNGAVSLVINGAASGGAEGVTVEVGAAGGPISLTGTGSVASQEGYGVIILNNGMGAINYDLSGPVVARGDGGASGVFLGSAHADAGDIVARTGSVQSEYDYGVIAVSNSRSGGISVTTDGDISGVIGGILGALLDPDATGDIAITANRAVRGDFGIGVQNLGLGAIRIAANGAVTGTADYGVYAAGRGDMSAAVAGSVTGATGGIRLEHGGVAGDLSVTGAGAVTGQDGNAVEILNGGLGTVTVDMTGTLTATNGSGLLVRDGGTGGNVNVAVGSVSAMGAGASGVDVVSAALGANVDVLTRGAVSGGADGAGVLAMLDAVGAAGDVRVNTQGAVRAGTGIQAVNHGSGSVTVATAGAVTGTAGYGLLAMGAGDIGVSVGGPVTGATTGVRLDHSGAAGDLSLTGAGAITGQNGDAVTVVNRGLGTTTVNLTGALNATGGSGLRVRDTTAGGALDIAVGAITAAGTANGVDVVSLATGANMSVLSRGAILLSGNGTGILAGFDSAAATGNVNVNSLGTISAARGILAFNDGAGSVAVTSSGPIVAGEHGVVATSNGGDVSVRTSTVVSALTGFTGVWADNQNAAGAGNVTVEATNINAWRGVMARNLGDGETRVTTTGAVQATDIGVFAFAGAGSSDVTVDVRDVSGGLTGVYVDNNGVGNADVTVRGAVSGSDAGVAIRTSNTQAVRLTNAGTIRNTSGLGSDAAIIFEGGGSVDLINTGSITGELSFGGDVNVFDNRGSWTAAGGDTLFAGADDELINAATGSILASTTAGVQDVTVLRGLETFRNAGRLSMGDNGAGDVVMTSANSVFAAGSVLQLDISGQGLADLFFTTGTLAIEAGARLDVNFVQPLALNGRYVVARADGGLTGRFDFEDRLLSAFVGLRDGYSATTAYIEVGQLRALAEAALTRNQRETATGVDSLPGGNALKDAVLLLPSDAVARGAFDQLSGEIHPAVRRAMVDDSAMARDAVLDRLVDDRADSRIWGQVMMAERKTDGDGNASRFENDARGLLFGAEQRQLGDTVTVGLAGGWFLTDLNLLDRASTGRTETTQVLAYMGARMDRWGLRTGVGYARTSTETQRDVAFPGFTASPAADYDGSVLQVFVDGGYRLPLHGGYVEPFANVTMVSAETGAFTETDGAQASLSGELKSDDVLITTLGARFETGRESNFALRGMAGWRGMTGDLEPIGRHAFAGGETFSVLGPLHSDIGAVANLEGLWRVSPNFSVSAGYDAVFGSEGEDHTVSARLKVAF